MQVFDLIKKYNIKPRHQAGQNFLIDNNILDKIVQTANLEKADKILEVGSGLGVLTERLLEKSEQVLAVEFDKSLYYVLKQEFGKSKNLTLLCQNILDLRQPELEKIFYCQPYKIVANIPYNITSIFLRKFLEQFDYKPREMILLTQKEVAQRIVAKPGKMSLLAVSAQLFSEPKIIDYVSKNCFYPKPKVDSAIIRFKIKDVKLKKEEIKSFFRIVKIGFSAKRKQLQNNLANGLKIDRQEIKNILKKINLSENVRAQELSLSDWEKLAQLLSRDSSAITS